jgi:histidinol dehydrogenase
MVEGLRRLKQGAAASSLRAADTKVRETVEKMLAEIETRGDAAVRDYALKFDGWERDDFRLSESDMEVCLAQLTKRDLDDIHFAQIFPTARQRIDPASTRRTLSCRLCGCATSSSPQSYAVLSW